MFQKDSNRIEYFRWYGRPHLSEYIKYLMEGGASSKMGRLKVFAQVTYF